MRLLERHLELDAELLATACARRIIAATSAARAGPKQQICPGSQSAEIRLAVAQSSLTTDPSGCPSASPALEGAAAIIACSASMRSLRLRRLAECEVVFLDHRRRRARPARCRVDHAADDARSRSMCAAITPPVDASRGARPSNWPPSLLEIPPGDAVDHSVTTMVCGRTGSRIRQQVAHLVRLHGEQHNPAGRRRPCCCDGLGGGVRAARCRPRPCCSRAPRSPPVAVAGDDDVLARERQPPQVAADGPCADHCDLQRFQIPAAGLVRAVPPSRPLSATSGHAASPAPAPRQAARPAPDQKMPRLPQ